VGRAGKGIFGLEISTGPAGRGKGSHRPHMLFNSFSFIYLLVITFCLYYTPTLRRFQVPILILASFVFYAFHAPILLLLLIISPAINIITSYYIAHGDSQHKRAIAIAGISFELAILIFFKYSTIISRTFFSSTTSTGHFLLMIPLPIGISFFTFEGISLVVDVFTQEYFDRTRYVSTNLLDHARNVYCFISFFPHLIAGPIVKAHLFLPQIKPKSFSDIDVDQCFKALVLGYFLKMVIADNLKDFTFWIEYPYYQSYDTITLIALLMGYSAQIFSDFAGYSLIAVGLAGLFGYNLMSNFDFPYISSSFREFWKRWHISLSSFLMEYLYIPLGGSKKGRLRTYLNLMITMVLGGIWHGAAWSYAVWGAVHGAALATERLLVPGMTSAATPSVWAVTARRLMVFTFVSVAWLLFKLPDFNHVVEYIKTMISNPSLSFDYKLCTYIALYSCPVVLYHCWYLWKKNARGAALFRKVEYALYGTMLFMILTNSGSSGAFIYFQF
jgi:alginate O-acetyltransferase complex protein AlgI